MSCNDLPFAISNYEQCKYCPSFVDAGFIAIEEKLLIDNIFYRYYFPNYFFDPLLLRSRRCL
jgi:hypothetical protein